MGGSGLHPLQITSMLSEYWSSIIFLRILPTNQPASKYPSVFGPIPDSLANCTKRQLRLTSYYRIFRILFGCQKNNIIDFHLHKWETKPSSAISNSYFDLQTVGHPLSPRNTSFNSFMQQDIIGKGNIADCPNVQWLRSVAQSALTSNGIFTTITPHCIPICRQAPVQIQPDRYFTCRNGCP